MNAGRNMVTKMNESEHYENLVIGMLQESLRWPYWEFSHRKWAAVKRLINRGVIKMGVDGYPYWRFEIVGEV